MESHNFVALLLAVVIVFLAACGGSTPPGPFSIGGTVEGGASFHVLDWDEGLRIMLWNDLAENESYANSTSSTTDPLFRLNGGASAADGRGYEYHLETADGLEANFTIDGRSYDLDLGKLFLIQATGGETVVEQLDLDISNVELTQEGIEAYGQVTPKIAAITAGISQAAATPTPLPVSTVPQDTAQPPATSLTGVPELDQLAAAILENDLESRRERLSLIAAGCTNAEGLGGPPKCQPGQEEGSPVEYLPVMGPGEGVALLPEELDGSLDFQAAALYAAYRRAEAPINDPFFAPGEYGLIFAAGEAETFIQYILVHADAEGRIVRLDFLACPLDEAGQVIVTDFMTCSPAQILERDAGEVLLAPPQDSPADDTEVEGPTPEVSQAHPLSGLVYSTDEGIWIIDAAGEPSFIIDEPTGLPSADGRFVLYQPEYDQDIWLADLASGERHNLTASSGRYNGSAQWWPGKPELVLFGSSTDLTPGYGYPTTVSIEGSDYRMLDQERGGPVAVSADGEKLAYGGYDLPGRILISGTTVEEFNPADYGVDVEKVFVPAWSPDGARLAWKVSGNPDVQGWSLGIGVFDLESKSGRLIHTYTSVGGGTVPEYLSWSPNGEWLAFVTYNERAEDGRAPNLWIAHPDGSGETLLGPGINPVWSPDGSKLAYSRYDDSQFPNMVWVYDTATGEQSQVLPAGAQTAGWLLAIGSW